MQKKVLIIEDSRTDAAIIKDALETSGIEAFVATSGEDGIQLARQKRPDLIVLDLGLPHIDGYEVCRRLKKDAELQNITVVVVSVKNQLADITEAISAGASDYVIKPPSPEFLVMKIKLYLGMGE